MSSPVGGSFGADASAGAINPPCFVSSSYTQLETLRVFRNVSLFFALEYASRETEWKQVESALCYLIRWSCWRSW